MLVALDFTSSNLTVGRAAAALARRLNCRLAFLHVLEPVTDDPDIAMHWGNFPQERREQAGRRLQDWIREIGAEGAEGMLDEGRAFEAIVRTADEQRCDMLVLGRRSDNRGILQECLGSTAEKVARHARCPVLILGEEQNPSPQAPRRLLLATDFSANSLAAFPWAEWVARQYGTGILLANVQPPMGLPGTREYAWHWQQIDALREEEDAQLRAWRKTHLSADLPVETRVVEGTPHRALCRLAGREQTDLIVMATHGASGWHRLWLGGTAEGLLRAATCSVLLVPPARAGFQGEEAFDEPEGAAGPDLAALVGAHLRQDCLSLPSQTTIREALDRVRSKDGESEGRSYLYVTDSDRRLVGVLPVRRLLTAPLDARVSDHMIGEVAALRPENTLLEAAELFADRRLLALPVVDASRGLLGVVDLSVMSKRAAQLAGRGRLDEVFEVIGLRAAQVREAPPWRAFGFRFPWLLLTITSGTLCAALASGFATTLEHSLVLAFFLPLILCLGESVSVQAMTVAIQVLRRSRPTQRWYLAALQREVATAVLLGGSCGSMVGLIVWLWWGEAWAACSIAASIVLALVAACVTGMTVPTLLHAFRLDPKIAAGPVTLALVDIFTLLSYFGVAWSLL